MSDFWIRQGDTSPAYEAILKDDKGKAVDITGASVRFHMRARGGETKVATSATVVDGPAGKVSHGWSAEDTDTPGAFEAEFEVTYSDGTIETYPNRRYLEVRITAEIA